MIPLAKNEGKESTPPNMRAYPEPQLLKDTEDAEDSFYSAIV